MNDDTADPNSNLANSLPQIGDNLQPVVPTVPHGTKEGEPASTEASDFAEEAKLVAQIETTSEEVDKKALEVIEKELAGVKAAHPPPTIPPDLEDAGVKDPAQEAEKVVREGPSIDVPVTEDTYQQGLKTDFKGKWYYQEKEVVGVKSLAALALWVKRLVLRAHTHTMRVIFGKKVVEEKKKEDWR
ncbi:hypothetical protein HY024_03755 [Candidatus Curtissbacteria bacterium]|nr:hypothetical protein [Candidatus Curtissbacteria bacterium]